jgi:hypothetical protein
MKGLRQVFPVEEVITEHPPLVFARGEHADVWTVWCGTDWMGLILEGRFTPFGGEWITQEQAVQIVKFIVEQDREQPSPAPH